MANDAIVVGVDGSANSIAALRWAGAEARLRGVEVHAIAVWQDLSTSGYGYGFGVGDAPELLEDGARRTLREAVDAAFADPAERPEVILDVRNGSTSDVLVKAGAEAALVVVGARGHGGFAGLLLGSVSNQVAHHAPCPVVIVPASP